MRHEERRTTGGGVLEPVSRSWVTHLRLGLQGAAVYLLGKHSNSVLQNYAGAGRHDASAEAERRGDGCSRPEHAWANQKRQLERERLVHDQRDGGVPVWIEPLPRFDRSSRTCYKNPSSCQVSSGRVFPARQLTRPKRVRRLMCVALEASDAAKLSIPVQVLRWKRVRKSGRTLLMPKASGEEVGWSRYLNP
jgi:hypothetical protein